MSEKTLSIPRHAYNIHRSTKDYCHVPPKKSASRADGTRYMDEGAAQLVDPAGNIRPVVILGAAFVDGQPPEKIDVGSDFIMIEGVAASDIKPEQLLIQRADAG